MPPTDQIVPPPAEIDAELMAARQVSAQRVEEYKQSDNMAKRHGAMTREIGRVAGRDPEFALELVEGFEIPVKVNALAVIGKTAEDMGALSDARDLAGSEHFTPGQKSEKLSKVAEAAIGVDPRFAFESAMDIPLPSRRADALIEMAEMSKIIYMRAADFRTYPPISVLREDKKDSNFSFGLFRQMVRGADQTINENSLWNEHRNKRLAYASAELDLSTTCQALLRSDFTIDSALFRIGSYIKKYIKEGRFDELEEADPDTKVIIDAFRARVEEQGGENDDRVRDLGLADDLLDPVTDASALLEHLRDRKPGLQRELLGVIRDGASKQLELIESGQDEL